MIGKRAVLYALACIALLAAPDADAQTYPTKPVRMIVPFPPGGPIDVMARLVGDRMAQGLGQTVVIENRPGAGATMGSKAVASAEADGYTLLFGSSGSLAVTPALLKNAGYDPVKSFAPVAAVAEGTLLLATNPSVPAKTVAELVAHAKANPGKLNYGASARHAAAHRLGPVQAPDQDRRGVHPLQGRGAGNHRSAGGADAVHHRRPGGAACHTSSRASCEGLR